MKKTVTWIIVLCMILSMFSISALAMDGDHSFTESSQAVQKNDMIRLTDESSEEYLGDQGLPAVSEDTDLYHAEYIDENLKFRTSITKKYKSSGNTESDFLEKTANDYAYRDFDSRSNSSGRKELYNALLQDSKALWNSTVNIEKTEDYYILAEYDIGKYSLNSDEAVEVYYMFRNDHPVFYFASSTVLFSSDRLYYLVADEYISGFLRSSYQKRIENYVAGFEKVVIPGNNYGTFLHIHDALLTDLYYYDDDTSNAHNIIGAILFGRGVCEAYARTFELISNYYGFENIPVTGNGNGGPHIWNLVKLQNDNYYYVDCTFDDTAETDRYFAAGSEAFRSSHSADSSDTVGSRFLYDLPAVSTNDFDAPSPQTYSDGQLTYSISYGGFATVTGYSKDPSTLTIPATVNGVPVTTIGESAFADCSTLVSVTFPNTVSALQSNAFSDCSSLKKAVFPKDSALRSVGDYAFSMCSSLESSGLPDSVVTLEKGAFSRCEALTSLALPEGLTSIQQAALSGTGVTTLNIPASAVEYGAGCFATMDCLEAVTVAGDNPILKVVDNVLYIWDSWKIADISSDPADNPIDSIREYGEGWGLFLYPTQKKDKEFTLWQESVCMDPLCNLDDNTYIEVFQAGKCNFIVSAIPCDIKVSDDNPYYTDVDGYILSKDETKLIKSPISRIGSAQIPDSVKTIKKHAFTNTKFETVNVPNGVENLEAYAFSHSYVKEIRLPETIRSIGGCAFRESYYLEKINWPKAVNEIPTDAFMDCYSLTEFEIPENVTSIGFQAFDNASLKTLSIPKSVTEIGSGAFMNNMLDFIEIKGTVSSIDYNTLYGNWNLHAIVFGENAPTSLDFGGIQSYYYPEKLTVYYPNNASWTGVAGKNFGSMLPVEWISGDCRGHSFHETAVMPTCTKAGEHSFQCSECGTKIEVSNFQIPRINSDDDGELYHSYYLLELSASGHSPVYVPEANGVDAYWHCDRCNKDYMDAECTIEVGGIIAHGDVNGNGKIDAVDLTALARHLAKIQTIQESYLLQNADANRDGTVNSEDLTLLAKYVARIIPSL